MSRYSSHIWKPFDSAGAFTGGPRKLVLHTTEGSSAAGAFGAYADGGVPHFTWDLDERRKYQHIDTMVAASALRNDPGGVQTNKDGAIQTEIVGFAAETRHLTDAELLWLGEAIEEVCTVEGINITQAPSGWYDQNSGFTLATKNAQQRMSYATWEAFNGVCGHQHVPENHHWDPGALNYNRMLTLVGSATGDDDLPYTEQELVSLVAQGVDKALTTPGSDSREAVGKLHDQHKPYLIKASSGHGEWAVATATHKHKVSGHDYVKWLVETFNVIANGRDSNGNYKPFLVDLAHFDKLPDIG